MSPNIESPDIEALIAGEPGVTDCAVVTARAAGSELLVAYVVGDRQLDPTQLLEDMRSSTEPRPRLDAIVQLRSLPLRPDGTVDIGALEQLCPPVEAVAKPLEEQLRNHPAVEHAAVVAVPRPPADPRLHLDRLLPIEHASASIVESSTQVTTTQVSTTRGPALVQRPAPPATEAQPLTLPLSLQRAAEQFDATILHLHGDTEQRQTLSELLVEARRVLAGLRATGGEPGQFVLLLLTDTRDILPCFWGCVLGGLIPVIAAVPPSYTAASSERDKLIHVWRLLEQPLVIADQGKSAAVQGIDQFDAPPRVATPQQLRQAEPAESSHQAAPDDVAFVTLSSGSTGVPKCIPLTHRNILSRARGTNTQCDHTRDDVILNWLPFDHIGSISDWHLRCVELGCTMVYCAKERILADPLEWLRLFERHRVTHSWAPNFAYAIVNEALTRCRDQRWDLRSVRSLLTAGEAVSSRTVAELVDRLVDHGLSRHAVRPAFGMAELGSGITYAQPTAEHPLTVKTVDRDSLAGPLCEVAPDHPRGISFTSLGPVIPGMSMRIVDEQRSVVPQGTVGHLHVQGEAVCPGYLRNEAANRVFGDDGWFDTGDRGFILDEELYLSGRSKDTIIINGANYFPGEIEQIVEGVAGVEVSYTAACSVRPARSRREQLAVFFSPTPKTASQVGATARAIRQHVAQAMGITPDYLVPLAREHVPKTAIGKIQRRALAARLEAGALDEQIQEIDLQLGNERTLPDWFSTPVWRPRALRPALPRARRVTLVLMDATGLGRRLLARDDLGVVIRVQDGPSSTRDGDDDYRLSLDDPSQISALLEQVGSRFDRDIDIVDLRAYGRPPASWDAAVVEPVLRSSLEPLGAWASALSSIPSTRRARWVVVGHHGQPVHDHDPLCPVQSIVPTVLGATTQAHDHIDALHIDAPPAADATPDQLDALTELLVRELGAPVTDAEVALRDGQRYVRRLVPMASLHEPPQPEALRRGGLYVLTGGLGGIGVQVAQRLLRSYDARLLLVGRTQLTAEPGSPQTPAQTQRQARLQQLQAAGPVEYVALDVADAEGLREAVQGAERRLGCELAGVFHLAGVFRDTPLAGSSWADIQRVLAPKILGGLATEALLRDRPEARVIHFSSLMSVLPSHTGVIYGAANRLLDALSHQQRARGARSHVIAWSVWNGIGMNAEGVAEAALRAQGLFVLTASQGVDSLMALLSRPAAHVLTGLDRGSPAADALFEAPPQAALHLRGFYTAVAEPPSPPEAIALPIDIPLQRLDTIALTPDGQVDRARLIAEVADGEGNRAAPQTGTEEVLMGIWAEVLESRRFGVTDDFFSVGGHSLLAAELVDRINRTCRTTVPMSLVFEAPSIRQQAELINSGQYSEGACLIPLQPLGDANPLFCLCGIDLYFPLAQRLAPQFPVYGVFLPIEGALLDGKQTQVRVRDMARQYIEAIRSKQPHGPYRLLGVSFGAILAYEAAQQLREAGESVELLTIVDFILRDDSWRSRLRGAWSHLADLARDPTPRNLRHGLDVLWQRGRARVLAAVGADRRDRHPSGDSAPDQDQDTTAHLRWVRGQAYHRAWISYETTVQPYAGSALMFRARDVPYRPGFSSDPDGGWSHHVQGQLHCHQVPGDHLGVLAEPNVAVLAERLREHLG